MTTTARPRSGSIQKALEGIEHDPTHHIAGSLAPQTPLSSTHGTPRRGTSPEAKPRSFLDDLITMKWVIHPSSSFKMLMVPIILYINWALIGSKHDNPWRRFLWISNRLPDSPDGVPLYAKSYWDIAFVAYYVVAFSFIRQSLTIYVFKPMARHYGIQRAAKLDRFAEQAYALTYFTTSGLVGLWTMYKYLPTWYFRTEYFWIDYPHWEMRGTLKPFYLLQGAYWFQQFLILVLKVEKPRSDWKELIAHHIVTLWLIYGSYVMNMTLYGNAVYITMDLSDAFFSLAKLFNYLQMERTKTIAFAWFTCVWTYLRHYLNLRMLWSTWYEYDLYVPESARVWIPENGTYLPRWAMHQIFLAVGILQVLNLFWYFLLWRILLRAIFGSNLDDSRSDDEDESAEPANKKSKKSKSE